MFTYYRYLSKFHCEPKDWKELFEYIDYNATEKEINRILMAYNEGS